MEATAEHEPVEVSEVDLSPQAAAGGSAARTPEPVTTGGDQAPSEPLRSRFLAGVAGLARFVQRATLDPRRLWVEPRTDPLPDKDSGSVPLQLDATMIADRIFVLACPRGNPAGAMFDGSGHSLDDLKRFFCEFYPNAKIFSTCLDPSHTLEDLPVPVYPCVCAALFPPQTRDVHDAMVEASSFLNENPTNVVAFVSCDGLDRAGTFAAALLLYLQIVDDPATAIRQVTQKRVSQGLVVSRPNLVRALYLYAKALGSGALIRGEAAGDNSDTDEDDAAAASASPSPSQLLLRPPVRKLLSIELRRPKGGRKYAHFGLFLNNQLVVRTQVESFKHKYFRFPVNRDVCGDVGVEIRARGSLIRAHFNTNSIPTTAQELALRKHEVDEAWKHSDEFFQLPTTLVFVFGDAHTGETATFAFSNPGPHFFESIREAQDAERAQRAARDAEARAVRAEASKKLSFSFSKLIQSARLPGGAGASAAASRSSPAGELARPQSADDAPEVR